MPNRAVVQSAGQAFRIRAKTLGDVYNASSPVMHLFLRYAQALITQIAQTAVCNRHHALDEQLSRWLLMSLDRLRGDEVVMTQELISTMLGVRRESVTTTASKLQANGLIRYARGRITVLDRVGLERQAQRVLLGGQARIRPVAVRQGSTLTSLAAGVQPCPAPRKCTCTSTCMPR